MGPSRPPRHRDRLKLTGHPIGRPRQLAQEPDHLSGAGDRSEAAADVAALLDFDEVVAGCSPEEKVERVRAARRSGVTVALGDGSTTRPRSRPPTSVWRWAPVA